MDLKRSNHILLILYALCPCNSGHVTRDGLVSMGSNKTMSFPGRHLIIAASINQDTSPWFVDPYSPLCGLIHLPNLSLYAAMDRTGLYRTFLFRGNPIEHIMTIHIWPAHDFVHNTWWYDMLRISCVEMLENSQHERYGDVIVVCNNWC